MNRKRNTSILCFSVNKNDQSTNEDAQVQTVCKSPMSRSFHEPANCYETVSTLSTSLVHRPLPPPYDECTSKIANASNLKRSFSSYSTSAEKNFICKELSDDGFSQYSEGDPPKLIDESHIAPLSNNYIRPKSLRPVSPLSSTIRKKVGHQSNSKKLDKTTESPGADSGVRLTPNDGDYYKVKRVPEITEMRHEEMSMLKDANSKLAVKELTNQNLMNRASFFIERLRQKLKEKNQEIILLQNRVNESMEQLRIRDLELQLELEEANRKSEQIQTTSTRNVAVQTVAVGGTEWDSRSVLILQQQFEEERCRWLEEKSNVIDYHKQLNGKYQRLLDRNRELETELMSLQERMLFKRLDGGRGAGADIVNGMENGKDEECDEDEDDQLASLSYDLQAQLTTGQLNKSGRIVKLEESLC